MNEGFHPPMPPDPHHIVIEGTPLKGVSTEPTFPKPPMMERPVLTPAEQIASVEEKIKIAFKSYIDHAGEPGGDMRTEELLRLHTELARLQKGSH